MALNVPVARRIIAAIAPANEQPGSAACRGNVSRFEPGRSSVAKIVGCGEAGELAGQRAGCRARARRPVAADHKSLGAGPAERVALRHPAAKLRRIAMRARRAAV